MSRKEYIVFVAFFMFMNSYTMHHLVRGGSMGLSALRVLQVTGSSSSHQPLLTRSYTRSIPKGKGNCLDKVELIESHRPLTMSQSSGLTKEQE